MPSLNTMVRALSRPKPPPSACGLQRRRPYATTFACLLPPDSSITPIATALNCPPPCHYPIDQGEPPAGYRAIVFRSGLEAGGCASSPGGDNATLAQWKNAAQPRPSSFHGEPPKDIFRSQVPALARSRGAFCLPAMRAMRRPSCRDETRVVSVAVLLLLRRMGRWLMMRGRAGRSQPCAKFLLLPSSSLRGGPMYVFV
ncbi:hypothetical protein PENSPDRAFT_430247 [Peniophora sp. CONT]|nr:hypothetical protein PENSPDRAFT_430247 [Peniophora sp. CONT]